MLHVPDFGTTWQAHVLGHPALAAVRVSERPNVASNIAKHAIVCCRHKAGIPQDAGGWGIPVARHGWVSVEAILKAVRDRLNLPLLDAALLFSIIYQNAYSERAHHVKKKQYLEALVLALPTPAGSSLGSAAVGAMALEGTKISGYPQRVIALRALSGQTESPAMSLCDTQSIMPQSAVDDVMSFFPSHQGRTALKSILRRGILPQGRLGSMHSIYPPDDDRGRSMRRWGTDVKHDVTLVLNARRTWEYANKVSHGVYFDTSGSVTIPCALPMEELLDQVYFDTRSGKIPIFDARYARLPIMGMMTSEEAEARVLLVWLALGVPLPVRGSSTSPLSSGLDAFGTAVVAVG